jgi:D-3-phosphoglycerate dehydrogenase / 2-oxoglutarate reductase
MSQAEMILEDIKPKTPPSIIPRIMAIVLLETIHEDALLLLKSKYKNVVLALDEEQRSRVDWSHVKAIVTRGKGQVRQELIDRCSQLQTIARCGIGLDNIDVAYAQSKNILVLNAPGSNAQTVAEHTFLLMLSLVRNAFTALSAQKNQDWLFRNTYQGDEIYGKTLGIMGMGNIGSRVAAIGKAFGMKIIYHNLDLSHPEYEYVSRYELFSRSDVLSLHVDLNDKTRHLVNQEMLDRMSPKAFIINTARAEIMDWKAVSLAISNKKLAGLAVDVPLAIENAHYLELLKKPNVLMSPHIASLTARTYKSMCEIVIQKVIGVLG